MRQSNYSPGRPSAFTLVELLVVIAIIGVLVALLLPAVQAAREASRRSTCQSNLRQHGVALQNYHDVRKAFPPGAWMRLGAAGPKILANANVLLLPYLEQQALNASWKADRNYSEQDPAILALPVPIFTCPSNGFQAAADPVFESVGLPPGQLLATTDYSYSKGATDAWCLGNDYPPTEKGVFHVFNLESERPVSLTQITDGSTHTFLMGEAGGGQSWPTCRRAGCTTPEGHAQADVPWMMGDLSIAAHADAGYVYAGVYGSTIEPMNKWPVTGTILHEAGIFDCRSSALGGQHASSNFHSDHPGGVLFLHGDSSVHFIREDIDQFTYRAKSTYAGDELEAD